MPMRARSIGKSVFFGSDYRDAVDGDRATFERLRDR